MIFLAFIELLVNFGFWHFINIVVVIIIVRQAGYICMPFFVLCRLEGLYRYIHSGIPVLSHAESKMKQELEEIEEYLKFHRESLQQVHSFQLTCWGGGGGVGWWRRDCNVIIDWHL